jgi:poly(ADP-ribose) glycohydrolase ARH3
MRVKEVRLSDLIPVKITRFIGCLLGSAFGDVLGAAVEMQSRQQILQHYPELLRDFQATDRGYGCYTDDTEMTLALARSIVRIGDVDGTDCAAAYAHAFTPQRGYGRSAVQILTALQQGADWRQTGSMLFAEGSFGNGGAMRIAPVGLLYGDLDYPALYAKVKAAVWMTHTHKEGVDAALLQARAIGLMLAAEKIPDPQIFITQLRDYAPESILNNKLEQLSGLLSRQATAGEVAETFGCGVRSGESWPPALWAALCYCDDPEEAIIQAVNLGGDTDTVAAMTGALVGALHGDQWFPPRWFEHIENQQNGRDELISAAEQLARISVR